MIMPLFHVHGLIGVLFSTFASGGTTIVPSRFSASNFWPVALEQTATWYSGVPTMHQILLSRADSDNAPPWHVPFHPLLQRRTGSCGTGRDGGPLRLPRA